MHKHHLRRTAALGLALAALGAPAASAQTGQDLRSPDARDAARATVGPQDLRSPDARDAADGRGTFNSPQIVVVKRQTQPQPALTHGIDWGDAGIGAGSLLGLTLIALGGTLFITHRRHGTHDAPAAGL
jgi:hypothetical protein